MSGSRVRGIAGWLGACLFLGVILGALWAALAPRESMKVISGKAYPEGFQPRGFITDDVTLIGILAMTGLIVTSLLLLRYRNRPLGVLAVSAASGLLASIVAWLTGEFLGRADLAALAASSPDGAILLAPLEMRMTADLLAWPIVAAGLVTLATVVDWVRDDGRPAPPLTS